MAPPQQSDSAGNPPGIEVTRDSGVTVIAFTGEFDSLNIDGMRRAEQSVLATVDAAQDKGVVFDLTNTEFLGSAFLQMLVRCWHHAGHRGGTMALCGMRDFCRQVLTTAGMDRLWSLYPTRDEAIDALRAG